MEDKLYYSDAYLQQFHAEMLKQEQDENGNWYIVLSETAFYPTGGGQPNDIGYLENMPVIGVEEMDKEIRHYVTAPIEKKDLIQGRINWQRRFDHMQQHAGQHILSAAFAKLFDFQTVSFHLGKDIATIDLSVSELHEAKVKEAVHLANNIILENLPIETKWATTEELSQYQLRKAPSVTEDIRLVLIPGYDDNACGGTHPRTTGEVRAIKVLNWEKQKKHIRVQFVCGNRVLHQFDEKQSTLLTLTDLLSAPEQELPQTIKRKIAKEKELEKSIEKLKEKLISYEAEELISLDERIIGRTYEDRSIKELQQLAQKITEVAPRCAVFFVSKNKERLQVVAAKGKESNINCKKPVLDALPSISGKGGGSEVLVQGGGVSTMESDQFLSLVLEQV
ncbi:serine-tRNA(Ala) deacylase AlaX [Halalkalibacter okhensis]|uniref:Alanyl-tRNA synthetase n=1 Tax=Halalkalibacter okhensis TaxID=333138 RepID=A0A0B0I623_9BACI|nr:serine-tRNA(Ala) deacylase AlaX [Halalkalibacter okhensis]KHF37858.1 alanyl-tRNA synthetase [Halalkalibacter okhensis]